MRLSDDDRVIFGACVRIVRSGYAESHKVAAALIKMVYQFVAAVVVVDRFVRLTVLVDDLLRCGLLIKDEVAGENDIFEAVVERNIESCDQRIITGLFQFLGGFHAYP